MSPEDADPVLFFGRKLKYHFERNDFTQCPLVGDKIQTKSVASPLCPFHLNWNNSCSIKNSWFFGPEKFGVSNIFLLEFKFLALPPDLLYLYIYLEVGHRFFTQTAKAGTLDEKRLQDLIQPVVGTTKCFLVKYSLEDKLEMFANMVAIAKTFVMPNSNNYSINIFQMDFAWNDAALPCMIKEKRNRSRKFSSTGFNVNKVLTAAKEEKEEVEGKEDTDLIGIQIEDYYESKHSTKKLTTFSVYDRRHIEDLAHLFTKTRAAESESDSENRNPVSTPRLRVEDSVLNHFLNDTLNEAVTLNGTACVGKTTLLRKIISEITERFDQSARVHKASNFGGFSGKDIEQILALQYQLCTVGISKRQYTSVLDRGAFNNLIWRLILALLNTNEDLVTTFVKLFGMISPVTLAIAKDQPTIIIIDTNAPRNRRTMFYRNEGGDYQRCQIERYVVAQNLVYGVFATLCNWPLIDIADYGGSPLPESVAKQVQDLVVLKIKSNIERNGNKLPSKTPFGSDSWLLYTPHKFLSEPCFSENTPIDYSVARSVEIFK